MNIKKFSIQKLSGYPLVFLFVYIGAITSCTWCCFTMENEALMFPKKRLPLLMALLSWAFVFNARPNPVRLKNLTWNKDSTKTHRVCILVLCMTFDQCLDKILTTGILTLYVIVSRTLSSYWIKLAGQFFISDIEMYLCRSLTAQPTRWRLLLSAQVTW